MTFLALEGWQEGSLYPYSCQITLHRAAWLPNHITLQRN